MAAVIAVSQTIVETQIHQELRKSNFFIQGDVSEFRSGRMMEWQPRTFLVAI